MSSNGRKKDLRACALRENSNQSAHSHSLIRIFTGRILDSQGCKNVLMRTMKTLIRLRGCTSSFESLLGAFVRRFFFLRLGSNIFIPFKSDVWISLQWLHCHHKIKTINFIKRFIQMQSLRTQGSKRAKPSKTGWMHL